MKTKSTAKRPNFAVSNFEHEIINRIAEKAVTQAKRLGIDYDKMTALMDLLACHNSCPLDLNKLESAPAGDFGHDVFGIRRHMNRTTGELGDCFLPRCAMPDRSPTALAIEATQFHCNQNK